MYMNKKRLIKELSACAIAIMICSCSNTYPPSQYIGIYDYYDGYKNGELPFDGNYMYSGEWDTLYPNNKQIRIQGTYYKGKPDGKWKSFYKDGEMESFAIYSNGTKEQIISYYPDGIPFSISKSGKTTVYYPDGSLYVRSGIKSSSGAFTWNRYLLGSAPVQMSHFYETANASVYVFFYPEADNHLNIWSYIVTPQRISKSKITAILSNETGVLKDIKYDAIFGEMKLSLSSDMKNSILIMSLSLQNEQIKNAKLVIESPLAHPSEASSQNNFLSYSFQ